MKGFVSGVAMIVLLSTILFPSIAMAKFYIVGDEDGWRGGVDYQAWAANKIFFVGDVLVFRYVPGRDHVYRVDRRSLLSCCAPRVDEWWQTTWSRGNHFIRLAGPGRHRYIGDHCNDGQRFEIIVFSRFPSTFQPSSPPAPSPSGIAFI